MANCGNQSPKCLGRQMRGRSAAKKQRVDFPRLAQTLQLDFDGPQVVANQVVSPSQQREVAIAAPVPAKRHMDISRPRRRE